MSRVLRIISLVTLVALLASSCSQDQATRVERDLTDFQAAILEDSKVDFSEYERAILAAMSCVESHGFETRGPFETQGGRSLGFDAVIGDERDDNAQVQDKANEYAQVLETCEQEYLYPLVDVYNASITPSESEIQQGDEIVVECARRLGYDVADSHAAYEVVFGDLDSLAVCIHERDAFLYP